MEKKQTVYVKGLYGKEKASTAPEFVICKLSANKKDLIDFLNSQTGEWVNMDVVKARDAGKLTVKLDTWKPDPSKANPKPKSAADEEFDRMNGGTLQYPGTVNPDEIPFR